MSLVIYCLGLLGRHCKPPTLGVGWGQAITGANGLVGKRESFGPVQPLQWAITANKRLLLSPVPGIAKEANDADHRALRGALRGPGGAIRQDLQVVSGVRSGRV